MPHDPISAVQTMLAEGRTHEAITLIDDMASRGDVEALFQQAIWFLTGSPLRRNLPQARIVLRKAVERGHVEARLIEIALTANGSGAVADWHGAIRLLRSAAAQGDRYAIHLEQLIAAMPLTKQGAPEKRPECTPLTPDHSVLRVAKLLTDDECMHIVRSAADLLQPATVADPRTGRLMPHPVRTSDAAVLSPVREDIVLRAINVRLAASSGTDVRQGEALTVLRYLPGQQFRLHSDVLPNVRNQRMMTILIYLNDDFKGGETTFPDHRLTISPKQGDAVIFKNLDAAGRPLTHARHAGEPVVQGTKWLATRWIRARPFDVWTGPEAA